jgi:hypothetical protein
MTLRRVGAAAAATVIAVGVVVALAIAAAPAKRTHGHRSSRLRLLASPSRLLVARAIVPGDRIERLEDLRVRGHGRFTAVYFSARAKKSSVLDSDKQYGLQIAIDRCSKKWRKRRVGYLCPGKRVTVLARRPLLGQIKLRRIGLRGRGRAHLRLVISLPANAGNSLQGQSTDVTYSFVGVARGRRKAVRGG